MNPSCYVISAAEFSVLTNAILHLGWIVAAAFVVALVDWHACEWRIRRFLRRRRLQRIRTARMAVLP